MIDDAIRRLGGRVRVLHMKDFEDAPGEPRPRPIPCGTGRMDYDRLLRLTVQNDLPMTPENTTPDTAEAARLYLARVAV